MNDHPDDRDDQPDETEAYRSISGAAIAAAVLGGASVLSIFSPMLLVLPLLGIALAVMAFRDIEQSAGLKIGRLAALAGLALSIGFGVQGLTARIIGRRIMEDRVRRATTAWLEAVREDRLADAMTMLSPLIRPAPQTLGSDEDARPINDPVAQEEAFRSSPLITAIRGCGETAVPEVSFTGHTEDSPETEESWQARIRLSPCAGGRPVVVDVQLQSAVFRESTGWRERWTITDIDLVDEDAPPPPPY